MNPRIFATNSNFRSSRKGLATQSGQALIEYVLILVVIVSIILALSRQFMPLLRGYVDTLTGNYVECLLEQGQLPNLGGASASNGAQDSCESMLKMAKADLKSATDKNSSSGSSSSGGDSNKSSGSDSRSSSSSSSKDKDKNKNSSEQGGGGSGSSVSINGRMGNLNNSRSARSIESNSSDEDKVTMISQGKGSGYFRSRSSTVAGIGSGGRYIDGQIPLTEAQQRQIASRAETERAAMAVGGEEMPPAVKKTLVKPPPVKELKQNEDTGITIGNFFKYILIAAIIIVIIAVIGGQAASTSKGWED